MIIHSKAKIFLTYNVNFADSSSCDKVSSLECLSLNSCSLSDAFFGELSKRTQGKLLSLTEIDLSANDGLSPACLDQLVNMTTGMFVKGVISAF